MLSQRRIINKRQMLTASLPAKVMSFPIVFMKISKVREGLKFNLPSPFIPELFPLLFAYITLIVLFSEMSVKRIVVIKMFVVAMVARRMLFSFVLCNLVTTIQPLLEE